jgi:trimethylamine--corrinoid protein Co-methyltransferase
MSLEELVIADETFAMTSRLLKGVQVDRETLAVDQIAEMGFRGDYLFAAPTRAHVRELWQAHLSEVGTLAAWQAAGAPSTAQKARRIVDEILATPLAPADALPDDLGHEFERIIASVET